MKRQPIDQAKVSTALKEMIDLMNSMGLTSAEKAAAAEALARSACEVAASEDVGVRTA